MTVHRFLICGISILRNVNRNLSLRVSKGINSNGIVFSFYDNIYLGFRIARLDDASIPNHTSLVDRSNPIEQTMKEV
ncbi:hypothetical protein SAMN03003324_00454 [Pedobacter antarcticus]|uniref:Uncharacterized protein n=1 Tax=Pedobacter antarcticus TaxID=34086 RepID=A0A1I2AHE1_9SPHI|nr:hypothetical protein SAMN03003324_00454 [Pedobacter antarcticus]